MKGNPMKKIILSAIALFLLIGGIGLAQPTRRSGSSPIERASPVLWNSDGSVYLPANVGIGTTAASSALSVVGDISATGEVSGATLQAGGTSGVSEVRLDANNTVIQSVDANGIYLGDLNAANTVSLRVDGNLYIGASGGLTRFLTSTESLANAIATAPSGATLYLAPGATYTVATAITRTTPINIIGSRNSVISSTLSSNNYVMTFKAPTVLKGFYFLHTAGSSTGAGIFIDGAAGVGWNNNVVEDIFFDVSVSGSTSQTYNPLFLRDVGGKIHNIHITGMNTATGGPQILAGVRVAGNSTLETDRTVYLTDSNIYIYGTSAGAAEYGVYLHDNNANNKIRLFSANNRIYVKGGVATYGIVANGADALLTDQNSFISGQSTSGISYDVYTNNSSSASLSNTILDNGALSSSINPFDTTSITKIANIDVDKGAYLGTSITDRITIDGGVYQSNKFGHFKVGTTCYEVEFVPSYKVTAGITCTSVGM